MLSREGRQYMEVAPRVAMWPGVALTIVGARAAERAQKALQKRERSG